METLTLTGTCDMHIHSAPDIVPRIGNDVEIAKRARDCGMKAIVYKCVLEPTVSRAWHTSQQIPGIHVFGGIVLDHHIGGINPAAVEPCIQLGGKIVWLPTYHAEGHAAAFGKIGSFGGYTDESKEKYTLTPITIFDEQHDIQENLKIILSMCKEADIILGTGHISVSESIALAKYCRDIGFKKLLVNHPFFKVPGMDVETVGELVNLGAYIEFCANELCPIPGSTDINNYQRCVSNYGASHFILASDAGHNRKGWPCEELRVFAQLLGYSGINENELSVMMRDNYDYLLNL